MIDRLASIARRSSSEPSTDTHPPVALESVSHEYDLGGLGSRADRTVTALEAIDLTVETGDILGLRGPSGSGKSTILHAVAGLLVPTAGTVSVCGTELTALSTGERTRVRRDHVGIVFQRFHLLPALSARANVALPLVQAGYTKRARRRRAMTLLESVGLTDRADHLPRELSGGERQRVAIARALATDPDVLVADEPTGELDSETGDAILEVLTGLGDDRALLLASHDDEVLSIADRLLTLRDGRVVDRAP